MVYLLLLTTAQMLVLNTKRLVLMLGCKMISKASIGIRHSISEDEIAINTKLVIKLT